MLTGDRGRVAGRLVGFALAAALAFTPGVALADIGDVGSTPTVRNGGGDDGWHMVGDKRNLKTECVTSETHGSVPDGKETLTSVDVFVDKKPGLPGAEGALKVVNPANPPLKVGLNAGVACEARSRVYINSATQTVKSANATVDWSFNVAKDYTMTLTRGGDTDYAVKAGDTVKIHLEYHGGGNQENGNGILKIAWTDHEKTFTSSPTVNNWGASLNFKTPEGGGDTGGGDDGGTVGPVLPTIYNFQLKYWGNGGTGVPANVQEQTTDESKTFTETIPSTVPTYPGHTFEGWYCTTGTEQATGELTVNKRPGDTVDLDKRNASCTAVWTESKPDPTPEPDPTKYTFKLVYHANGGEGAPGDETRETTDEDASFDVKVSDTVPTYEGYTFQGWALRDGVDAATGDLKADKRPGDVVNLTKKNASLTAVWKKDETPAPSPDPDPTPTPSYEFKLKYYGAGGANVPADQQETSDKDDPVDMTVSSTVPTREGYTFKGWALREGLEQATGTLKADTKPGDKVKVTTKGASLTAVWERTPIVSYDYKLAYYANGGTGAPDDVARTATDDKQTFKITIPKDQTPTRDGYTFQGWAYREGLDMATGPLSADKQPGDTVDLTVKNASLTAVWRKNADPTPDTPAEPDKPQSYDYKLKYYGNGGTGVPEDVSETADSEDKTFDETIPKDTIPTREGYTFKGWAYRTGLDQATGDDLKADKQPGDTVVLTIANASLTAVWEKDPDAVLPTGDETPAPQQPAEQPANPVAQAVSRLPQTGVTIIAGVITLALVAGGVILTVGSRRRARR